MSTEAKTESQTVGLVPRQVECFTLPSRSVISTDDLRVDASRYNLATLRAIEALRRSGMRLHRLGDLTKNVFVPPRFKRTYVDADAGIPFLQGGHVVQFRPDDTKYLSRRAHDRLERWVIRDGWILVTCSGTVGRVTTCPPNWDGWAASQHIMRVVPDEDKCPSGYLSSFLASSFGHVQLTANKYGAVVDELTEEHAKDIIVPMPETAEDWEIVDSIDRGFFAAVNKRTEANALLQEASSRMSSYLKMKSVESDVFTTKSRDIFGAVDVRLDAASHNPLLRHAMAALDIPGMRTARLGDFAQVFMPTRFNRVWVEKEHGVPFLQGSHVVHFQATDVKHLAPASHNRVSNLFLRQGWILVTRSGTVGRVVMCPNEWDGWAASEHIIRVVPDETQCPNGYLATFLQSQPGQVQLSTAIHGAVVDELSLDAVRNVVVPLPVSSAQYEYVRRIDRITKDAMSRKSEAVDMNAHCINAVMSRFEIEMSGWDTGRRIPNRSTATVTEAKTAIV